MFLCLLEGGNENDRGDGNLNSSVAFTVFLTHESYQIKYQIHIRRTIFVVVRVFFFSDSLKRRKPRTGRALTWTRGLGVRVGARVRVGSTPFGVFFFNIQKHVKPAKNHTPGNIFSTFYAGTIFVCERPVNAPPVRRETMAGWYQ